MKSSSWVWAFLFVPMAAPAADESKPVPKPVPLMQAIPLPHAQISFQRDGRELARYHFATNLLRPFIYPVIGPSGRSLTRLGHPHDPESHSHHNSIWISHNDVNGISFWDDRGRGRIVHQRIERFDDGDRAAAVTTMNAWLATNLVLLTERRRIAVQPLPNEEWLLTLDLELEAKSGEVSLGKTPFGLVGVRMAKTIGVNDGGGTIRSSAGGVNEREIFWKPAKWVDYSGPITSKAMEGITLFDPSTNPNHPSIFHVRNDGWMGAALTQSEPRLLRMGQPLRVRYGFYVHDGMPAAADLERRWTEFVNLP